MNINKLLLLLLPTVLFIGGCYQIVHVTDPAGDPVKGAKVMTQFASEQGGGIDKTVQTNRWGDAWLPLTDTQDPPAWILIKCQGYRTKGIAYTLDNKINVEIQPISLP